MFSITTCFLSQNVFCHNMFSVTKCFLSQNFFYHKMFPITKCFLSQNVFYHKMFPITKCFLSQNLHNMNYSKMFPLNDYFFSLVIMKEGAGLNIQHIYIAWVVHLFLKNPATFSMFFLITFGDLSFPGYVW